MARLFIDYRYYLIDAFPDELDWYSQKINILKPRAMHTTISYGNVLILIGGDTQDGTPAGIEFFNPGV